MKAFNTIPAAILAADPAEYGGRRVVFLAGNDVAANAAVAGLIERLGFAAIDLGKVTEGGRLQQFGGPLVAVDLSSNTRLPLVLDVEVNVCERVQRKHAPGPLQEQGFDPSTSTLAGCRGAELVVKTQPFPRPT